MIATRTASGALSAIASRARLCVPAEISGSLSVTGGTALRAFLAAAISAGVARGDRSTGARGGMGVRGLVSGLASGGFTPSGAGLSSGALAGFVAFGSGSRIPLARFGAFSTDSTVSFAKVALPTPATFTT